MGSIMVAFFILASGCEVYSSLFSCCCLSRGGNKFSTKCSGKMFKRTGSSTLSMVGTLWTVTVCIFFVLTQKLKPKIQITAPRFNFAYGYYHGYSLTEARISLSINDDLYFIRLLSPKKC